MVTFFNPGSPVSVWAVLLAPVVIGMGNMAKRNLFRCLPHGWRGKVYLPFGQWAVLLSPWGCHRAEGCLRTRPSQTDAEWNGTEDRMSDTITRIPGFRHPCNQPILDSPLIESIKSVPSFHVSFIAQTWVELLFLKMFKILTNYPQREMSSVQKKITCCKILNVWKFDPLIIWST